ncbi:phosphotransferase enzyme family protein [Tenacibaculum sp. SG-28]|uniref:phosphotransferase enzyme family protein n=1 Tax=Tenacibaculum sp. SG-28 TaxID=754426 RepID=UPI000CF3BE84|nr:phosphotransferase [Tenacibaculum sp. SG-28]PQJ20718.1 hypothetical protein BSU00_10515 [Tenacibaculum sp. SG-28]
MASKQLDIIRILNAFAIQGDITNIEPIASGYINTTYKISTTSNTFILQKINHTIFKNVPQLTVNIIRITEHLSSKANTYSNGKNLRVIPTKENKGYYREEKHGYWRMFNYLENTKTFPILENKIQAEFLGKAFGEYQKMLLDLPKPDLYETIPNFHNTEVRIQQFEKAISIDLVNRISTAKEEIDYLLSSAKGMNVIQELGKQGKLPKRNIHQDTKISNILFDKDNKTTFIIDLDTTMLGYLAYDFGDAVRTGMNTANENEKNLNKVSLNLSFFEAFTQGYTKHTKDFITPDEIASLVVGVKVITFEQAIRFLSDYLNGDTYYKTSYTTENLTRAKVQIKLLKDIEFKYRRMEAIVHTNFHKKMA